MGAITLDTRMPTYHRKIKCPRHILLKPGHAPYMMERIPALRRIKPADAVALNKYNPQWKLRLYQAKKDRYGNKILNPASYFQPDVSAALMRERVYQTDNPICRGCKRCVTA